MPTKNAHLQLANVNQSALTYLAKEVDDYPEWVTTVAFYKALHLVEAVFAGDPKVGHSPDHATRMRVLKKTNSFKNLYNHFRPLMAASEIARYLRDNTSLKEYTTFRDYMPPEVVQTQIIEHRLRQVELAAHRLLKRKRRKQRAGTRKRKK